jgi:hypothetical protein
MGGMSIKRGKRYPASAPKAFGPRELSGEVAASEARRADTRQVRPAGPNPREISYGKTDFEFQFNLDFGKNLGNFTRRFRRNLDMRIFLNYSWLLKDV